MASNSHQRSGSSGHSTRRKQVHVGTGARSRTASAEPRVEVERSRHDGGRSGREQAERPASGSKGRRSDPRRPARPLSAKQQERERLRIERRRVLLRRALLALGVLAAIAGLRAALVASPLFTVTEVEVLGASELSSEEVIAIADIGDDATLLRLDEDAILERLSGIAWIESADVVRSLPSTVRLEVVERRRYVMVDTGTAFWAVDESGRVLAESVPSTSTPVPVVRDVPAFDPVPGEVTDSEELQNAIRVVAGISEDLRVLLKTISAPSVEETGILTSVNIEIMIGEAVQLREKSSLALDIMTEQGSGVVFIDVRSVERAISRGIGN